LAIVARWRAASIKADMTISPQKQRDDSDDDEQQAKAELRAWNRHGEKLIPSGWRLQLSRNAAQEAVC